MLTITYVVKKVYVNGGFKQMKTKTKKVLMIISMLILMFGVCMQTGVLAAEVNKEDIVIEEVTSKSTVTVKNGNYKFDITESINVGASGQSLDVNLSAKTTKTNIINDILKTGDGFPIIMIITILAISTIVFMILVKKNPKRSKTALMLAVMLLTGAMFNTVSAININNNNETEIILTKEILEVFKLENISDDNTKIITDENGNKIGFKWELDNTKKEQQCGYSLELKDSISKESLNKLISVSSIGASIKLIDTNVEEISGDNNNSEEPGENPGENNNQEEPGNGGEEGTDPGQPGEPGNPGDGLTEPAPPTISDLIEEGTIQAGDYIAYNSGTSYTGGWRMLYANPDRIEIISDVSVGNVRLGPESWRFENCRRTYRRS